TGGVEHGARATRATDERGRGEVAGKQDNRRRPGAENLKGSGRERLNEQPACEDCGAVGLEPGSELNAGIKEVSRSCDEVVEGTGAGKDERRFNVQARSRLVLERQIAIVIAGGAKAGAEDGST